MLIAANSNCLKTLESYDAFRILALRQGLCFVNLTGVALEVNLHFFTVGVQFLDKPLVYRSGQAVWGQLLLLERC